MGTLNLVGSINDFRRCEVYVYLVKQMFWFGDLMLRGGTTGFGGVRGGPRVEDDVI